MKFSKQLEELAAALGVIAETMESECLNTLETIREAQELMAKERENE